MAADDAAVVVTLRASLKDYDAAMKTAVRTAEKAAAAAEKAVSGVGKQANFRTIQNETAGAGRSLQAMEADAKNLTFQLNDITQGLLGGQSPFQVMIQQGSQVSQVLVGAGGISNGLKLVGSSFMGLLNPVALVSSALILAVGYAVQYFTTAEKEAGEASGELQKHADAIQKVADKYGLLYPELKRIAALRSETADAAGKAEAKEQALAGAYEETSKTLQGLEADLSEIENRLTALGAPIDDIVKLQEEFGGLTQAVDDHKASSADAKEVVDALNRIIDSSAGTVQTLARAIRDQLVASFTELDRAAASAGETIKRSLDFQMPGEGGPLDFDPVFRARANAASRTPSDAKEFLKTKAASTAIADSLDRLDDETARAMAKLFAILPDTARITSGVRSYEEQARLRARYERGEGGLAARPGHSRHEEGTFREGGAALDIGQGVSMDELRAAVKLVPELEQLKGRAYAVDKVHVQLAGESARVEKAAAEQKIRSEEEALEASDRRLKKQGEALTALNEMITAEQAEIALKEQINAINADLTLSDDQRAMAILRVTTEAAKEAEVETLLNQAREAGLAITPQLIAQYEALAAAKVNAIIQDKELANASRDAAKRTQENAQAMEQFGNQMAGIAKGAISGFIQDLRAGKSAGEAFSNMLDRIIDGLINMALEALFAKNALGGIMGGMGGGMGGGGFTGGLFHKGGRVNGGGVSDGRRFSPALWANAPRYQSGGFAGLKPGEIPAILHRGELVIPTSAMSGGRQSKAGDIITTTLGDVKIDMSKSGFVAGDNERAKSFAANVQKLIQMEMVRESRPGGLLRRVPA